jgi:capsule polysaccharide export protein KpsE/RkpR
VPRVKPQYRGEGSAIDPSKCDDEENYYNRWFFDVYIEQPHGNKVSTRKYLLKASDGSDIQDLEFTLKSYFEERIKQGEQDVRNKNRNYYEEEKMELFLKLDDCLKL